MKSKWLKTMVILKHTLPIFFFLLMTHFANAQPLMLTYANNQAIKFGVLVSNAGNTTSDKVLIARDSLGVNWVRTKISMFSWNGINSPTFDVGKTAGLKQLVVLGTYPSGSPQPWVTDPTELSNYATNVNQVLNTYPEIADVIVDNEEITTTYPDNDPNGYHSGNLQQYINQCNAIKPICKAHNVAMINGGIYGGGLYMYVYRWIVNKYGQSVADDFGNRCMTNTQINAAKTVNSNPSQEFYILQIDTILNAGIFDKINIHPYQPFGFSAQKDTITQSDFTVLRYIKECVEDVTGKPCISNENGTRNNERGDFITSCMNVWLRLGLQYVFYWSGVSAANGTKSLTDDNGSPNEAGQAYKSFILQHK